MMATTTATMMTKTTRRALPTLTMKRTKRIAPLYVDYAFNAEMKPLASDSSARSSSSIR
jgi:hypothetical protein